MSQNNLIRLVSTMSPYTYWAHRKRRKGGEDKKLEIKKYDPTIRMHVLFIEKKK